MHRTAGGEFRIRWFQSGRRHSCRRINAPSKRISAEATAELAKQVARAVQVNVVHVSSFSRVRGLTAACGCPPIFCASICAKIIRGTFQHERQGWDCAALLLREVGRVAAWLFIPEEFVADEHAAAADNCEDSALFANDFVNDAIRADDQLAESFKVIWRLCKASFEFWPFHPCGK